MQLNEKPYRFSAVFVAGIIISLFGATLSYLSGDTFTFEEMGYIAIITICIYYIGYYFEKVTNEYLFSKGEPKGCLNFVLTILIPLFLIYGIISSLVSKIDEKVDFD